MARVIVVGAGVAGLGAGYLLEKKGVDVKLLEATPHVGGRIRSMEWNGAWIDLGAEFIATPGFEEGLFQELGIAGDQLEYPGGEVKFDVWRDGAAHEFNYTRPTGILRFGGMTWWEKLQMVRLIPAYAKMSRSMRGHPFEPWRGAWADDLSVEGWLSVRAPGFLEYVVEPMFELYCGWEPAHFGRGAFLATSFVEQLPRTSTFRRGLGQVTEALAARLDVTTGAPVTQVDLEADPVRVTWRQDGNAYADTADAVLIAVPGSRVLDFTSGLTPERVDFFRQVSYVPHEQPYFTVSERPEGVPDSVFFPRKEDREIAALGYDVASTNPDVRFLRIWMKTRHVVAQLDKSDDDDLDEILRQAARRYPSIPEVVEDRFVSRWREGLPLFPAGSLRRLRDFAALPPQRGVAFAGDYLCTGATSAAYQTGRRAAGDLLTRL